MQSSVSYSYDPGTLALDTETITIDPDGSGPLPSLTRTLSRSRDNLRRPTGFVLGNEHAVGYGYDVSGRLATLSAQGLPNLPGKTHAFEYTYEVVSNLIDKVTGPVHEVDNDYEPHRDVLLQKTNTRTVGIPGELSVIGCTVNAIGQREQRNLSGEIRADFYGGQTTDLYTTDWGHHALGQVVVHYEYDAFGPGTRFDYRFSTKPRDPTTGLYYYGFRWFDPHTGRWPSRDPIEESGGVNLYGFVGNDGVRRFDVLGNAVYKAQITTKSFIDGYDSNGFGPGGFADGSNHRMNNFLAYGALFGFEINDGMPIGAGKDGSYRLFGTVTLNLCCANSELLFPLTSDFDMDGGAEAFGLRGTIDGLTKLVRLSDSDVGLTLRFWGRPAIGAEVGLQAIRKRHSFYIWSHAQIPFKCAGDMLAYEIIASTGSKFPSRKLWVNGEERSYVKQGNFADLWKEHPLVPFYVAP